MWWGVFVCGGGGCEREKNPNRTHEYRSVCEKPDSDHKIFPIARKFWRAGRKKTGASTALTSERRWTDAGKVTVSGEWEKESSLGGPVSSDYAFKRGKDRPVGR